MNTRLQPLSVGDLSGGLNLDRPRGTTDDYSVTGNESPEMLNMEIDPRGGFYTRLGWTRWNASDPMDPVDWMPLLATMHSRSDGSFSVYVAVDGSIWTSTEAGVFTDLAVTASCSPHGAEFATWGDTMYFACGTGNATYRRVGTGAMTALTDVHGAYNDTYTLPVGGKMPKCEHLESHAGYMFAAGTTEGGVLVPNRLRWSHPDQPEDWHSLDYLDIHTGGGKITALKSFQDHLLIFKTESIWGLYGYDTESFQLVRISQHSGTPSPMSITRSEGACFFYSPATQGGIYAYTGNGNMDHLSVNLRKVMEEISEHEHVCLGWVGHRLWCSIPWQPGVADEPGSTFVYNPEATTWVMHRPALGKTACIIESSDVYHEFGLALMHGNSGAACAVNIHAATGVATDAILEDGTLSAFDASVRTGWINAGWPERRKSWRRPRFMVARPSQTVTIRVDVFWDYDSTAPRRTGTLTVDGSGTIFWRLTGSAEEGGFDWGDGSIWGSQAEGSVIDRADQGGGLGVSRAIAVEFSTDPSTAGRSWNLNEMMLKYALRRFTT